MDDGNLTMRQVRSLCPPAPATTAPNPCRNPLLSPPLYFLLIIVSFRGGRKKNFFPPSPPSFPPGEASLLSDSPGRQGRDARQVMVRFGLAGSMEAVCELCKSIPVCHGLRALCRLSRSPVCDMRKNLLCYKPKYANNSAQG